MKIKCKILFLKTFQFLSFQSYFGHFKNPNNVLKIKSLFYWHKLNLSSIVYYL